jgi:hypothetical protein
MVIDFSIIPGNPVSGKTTVDTPNRVVTAVRAVMSGNVAPGTGCENLAPVTGFLVYQVPKAQFWMSHCVRMQCWVYVQFMGIDFYD